MLRYDLFISEDNDFENPDVILRDVEQGDMQALVKLLNKYGDVNIFANILFDDQEED